MDLWFPSYFCTHFMRHTHVLLLSTCLSVSYTPVPVVIYYRISLYYLP